MRFTRLSKGRCLMIEFHKVEIDDRKWIKECFAKKKNISCEYSFGNLFGYGRNTDVYVANCGGFLVSKWDYNDIFYYSYPIGNGNIEEVLRQTVSDAENQTKHSRIFGMTAEDALVFKSVFGEKYKVAPNRNAFDYVYLTEDLIDLKGRKYQPKRNHISFFKKNNEWSFEEITQDNIAECIEMNEQWLASNDTDSYESLEKELKMIKAIFDNYEELGFSGGLLRSGGRVVAFTMGEPLNEKTFCVHFEKAFHDIRGAYPMINQQFVSNMLGKYKYINREDDVGLENLRKAKLSYHPAFLFEKYEAEIV